MLNFEKGFFPMVANRYSFFQLFKHSFSVFSLITYEEIDIVLFGVFMILGKQKTPGAVPILL